MASVTLIDVKCTTGYDRSACEADAWHRFAACIRGCHGRSLDRPRVDAGPPRLARRRSRAPRRGSRDPACAAVRAPLRRRARDRAHPAGRTWPSFTRSSANALTEARELTAEMAEALAHGGLDAAAPLVWEWRGALFRVRFARRRLERPRSVLAPVPEQRPVERPPCAVLRRRRGRRRIRARARRRAARALAARRVHPRRHGRRVGAASPVTPASPPAFHIQKLENSYGGEGCEAAAPACRKASGRRRRAPLSASAPGCSFQRALDPLGPPRPLRRPPDSGA